MKPHIAYNSRTLEGNCEAAFVIRYGSDAYTAVDFDDAFTTAAALGDANNIPLDVSIMDWFVACLVGDSELYYDAEEGFYNGGISTVVGSRPHFQ